MTEPTARVEIQSWLEAAADSFMRGETPTEPPSDVLDTRWEHNAPLAGQDGSYWTSESPRPGWTFTVELENGEKLTTHRLGLSP